MKRVGNNWAHDWVEDPVVKLMHIPSRSKNKKRLEIKVTLDEGVASLKKGSPMRCNFVTELKIDIDTHDEDLRKAFIDLILGKAREAYGVAGMLAKNTPIVTCSVIDKDGKQALPLFGPVRVDDDDSGE